MKIYLDTNIFDNLTKDDSRSGTTKETFSLIEKGVFEAYYSPTVIEELLGTKDKKQIGAFIKILNDKFLLKQCIKPIFVDLSMLKAILNLVDQYSYKSKSTVTGRGGKKAVWEKSVFSKGKSQAEDRIHIATATINQINVFVTWNTKEFIKSGKIAGWVNDVNERQGYPKIRFCSPETLNKSVVI